MRSSTNCLLHSSSTPTYVSSGYYFLILFGENNRLGVIISHVSNSRDLSSVSETGPGREYWRFSKIGQFLSGQGYLKSLFVSQELFNQVPDLSSWSLWIGTKIVFRVDVIKQVKITRPLSPQPFIEISEWHFLKCTPTTKKEDKNFKLMWSSKV